MNLQKSGIKQIGNLVLVTTLSLQLVMPSSIVMAHNGKNHMGTAPEMSKPETSAPSAVTMPAEAVAAASIPNPNTEHHDDHPISAPTPAPSHGGNSGMIAEHEQIFDKMYGDRHDFIVVTGEQNLSDLAASLKDGAKVEVRGKLNVDIKLDFSLKDVFVANGGELNFLDHSSVKVETIVVAAGAKLNIGTEDDPADDVTITFADRGPIDPIWDPFQFSRGLIIHGSAHIFGETKTTSLESGQSFVKGATTLKLASIPVNWKAGDQIVIAGGGGDELRTIKSISGMVVELTEGLSSAYTLGDTDIANLSRSITFQSETAVDISRRGHVMFMHSNDVRIEFAAFSGLGRTDKGNLLVTDPELDANGLLIPGSADDPRGRYSLHFHKTGQINAIEVKGVSIAGSPGWGAVNHSSYVNFSDSVAYNIVGAAFVTEVGDEIGSFRNNIAIHVLGGKMVDSENAKLNSFGTDGTAFWLQSSGINKGTAKNPDYVTIKVTGNKARNVTRGVVVRGSLAPGVKMTQGVPGLVLDGNEVYDVRKAAFEIWNTRNVTIKNSVAIRCSRDCGLVARDAVNVTFDNVYFTGAAPKFDKKGNRIAKTTYGIKTNPSYAFNTVVTNSKIENVDIVFNAPGRGINRLENNTIIGTRRAVVVVGNTERLMYFDNTVTDMAENAVEIYLKPISKKDLANSNSVFWQPNLILYKAPDNGEVQQIFFPEQGLDFKLPVVPTASPFFDGNHTTKDFNAIDAMIAGYAISADAHADSKITNGFVGSSQGSKSKVSMVNNTTTTDSSQKLYDLVVTNPDSQKKGHKNVKATLLDPITQQGANRVRLQFVNPYTNKREVVTRKIIFDIIPPREFIVSTPGITQAAVDKVLAGEQQFLVSGTMVDEIAPGRIQKVPIRVKLKVISVDLENKVVRGEVIGKDKAGNVAIMRVEIPIKK